ncbi:MAG: hypothetical protein QM778_09820 [Myxococcales bacterium]
MRVHSLILCCVASMGWGLLGGCGDDDNDNDVPSAVREVCATQADKGQACGYFDSGSGVTRGDYIKLCEATAADEFKSCTPKDSAVDACRKAYEAQDCDQVGAGEMPDECVFMCQKAD